MKRNFFPVLFACSAFLLAVVCIPAAGHAGLPAPPLPPLILPAPPVVVLIPGTYVYFPPDVGDDLLFYHGYWYRPYSGRWYRAGHYDGPWGFVAPGKVPRVLIDLPPGFRSVSPGHQRIPYGQLKKSWKTWEREKHWDKAEKRPKSKARKKGKYGKPENDFGHGGGKGRGR